MSEDEIAELSDGRVHYEAIKQEEGAQQIAVNLCVRYQTAREKWKTGWGS